MKREDVLEIVGTREAPNLDFFQSQLEMSLRHYQRLLGKHGFGFRKPPQLKTIPKDTRAKSTVTFSGERADL
jgi:hypothetical protein